ncbi:MAG TPA: hypothetical protein VF258_10205, partial [Luteolibacter sp.]
RNASSNSSYSYRNDRESAAERALKAYQSMDRPQTRGELACNLLTSTLPGMTETESTPQMIADAAVEFWKANRGKSKLDLLLVFLAEGNAREKQIASTALAKMPDEAARLAFEKHVLESEELTSLLDSVATYLKLRKAAAKDFFTRFSAALKAQLDGVDLDRTSGGYAIRQAGGVDKYLKKLSLLVGGESPRKLLIELAKAQKPDKQQIASLAATIAESSPDTFVPLYLEAAALANHLETRAAFLTALSRHAYNFRSNNEENLKETPVPATQLPHWTTLLEDNRPTSDGERIQSTAAEALERIHCSVSQEQVMGIYQVDPSACDELLLARARARVTGKAPTPLPAADKVPSARLDEILRQLAAAKPETVNDLAQAWTLDEKLAYQKWRNDPEHIAKIPASVLAARKLLATPPSAFEGQSVNPKSTEILQSLDLKLGTKIDADRLVALVGKLATESKAQSGLCIRLSCNSLNTGMIADADSAFAGSPGNSGQMMMYYLSDAESSLTNSEGDARVVIQWFNSNGRGRNNAMWKFAGTAVTPPETEPLEKFKETVGSLDQPTAQQLSLLITILHRDDLQKLEKLRTSHRNHENSGNSEDSETEDESDSMSILPSP